MDSQLIELPGAISAFFYMSSASEPVARQMQRRFIAEFGLEPTACPLLRLSLRAVEPFANG